MQLLILCAVLSAIVSCGFVQIVVRTTTPGRVDGCRSLIQEHCAVQSSTHSHNKINNNTTSLVSQSSANGNARPISDETTHALLWLF